MQVLTEEMENIIIEMNVKKDSGPLKSIWEEAIMRRGVSVAATDADDSLGLPSPISPNGTPRQRGLRLDADPEGLIPDQGRLLLPRPSPSPFPGTQRSSNYARARSISY